MEQLLNLKFNPFPVLTTERLILREITQDDVEDFFNLRSNLEVAKALDKEPLKYISEAKEFISFKSEQLLHEKEIRWAICLKENDTMIGCVGFHRIEPENYLAEIGYELLPTFHRQGIITEAIMAALNFAFNQIGLQKVEAGVNPDNFISINLLSKFGFTKSRHIKEDYLFNGVYLDSDYYSLTKYNYLNNQSIH